MLFCVGCLPRAFFAVVVIIPAISFRFAVLVACVVARVVAAAVRARAAACVSVGFGVRVSVARVSVVWVAQVTRSGFRVPGVSYGYG